MKFVADIVPDGCELEVLLLRVRRVPRAWISVNSQSWSRTNNRWCAKISYQPIVSGRSYQVEETAASPTEAVQKAIYAMREALP